MEAPPPYHGASSLGFHKIDTTATAVAAAYNKWSLLQLLLLLRQVHGARLPFSREQSAASLLSSTAFTEYCTVGYLAGARKSEICTRSEPHDTEPAYPRGSIL